MQKTILLIIFAIFISCSSNQESKTNKQQTIKDTPKPNKAKLLEDYKNEYAKIDTKIYLEEYIEKVIREGSSGLGFPSGKMQAGFADESDVQKIAHFVVTLSGKKCKRHELAKKAQMFYTSNCGGCHGSAGKGLNGAFPDLTKDTLLGIQKRKEYLQYEINKLSLKKHLTD